MKHRNISPNQCIYLCAFIYFISYITRTNYNAIIAEMVASTGLAKSTLSMALTGSFITYGGGQLISGWFGDRVQPKYLIGAGLGISVCMNLLIPLCGSPVLTTVIWCLNGLAQAFMWPPIVKLMSSLLCLEDYNRGCVKVSWGSSLGTMFIYLTSPLLISLAGWKSVFVFSAALGIAGLVLWAVLCPRIDMVTAPKARTASGTAGLTASWLLVPIMAAIVLQGILRDGVTTWMPSYISETYHLSSQISILVGVVLPIFSLICHQISGWLYSRKFKDPILCAGVIFAAGTVAALFLYLLKQYSPASSVFFSAVLTGCMHGVNVMFTCMLPPFLAKDGNISTVSGILNACTYAGSAISAYVIPLATECAGWNVTLLLWLLIALAGTALSFCLAARKKAAV